LRALAPQQTPLADIWDGRWRIHAPDGTDRAGLTVKSLGEAGLALCPDWRATTRPRRSLLTTPAVWRGGALIAAPLARQDPGWRAELLRGRDDLRTSFLLH
jgi:tRNA(Ile)-lysidine synthase